MKCAFFFVVVIFLLIIKGNVLLMFIYLIIFVLQNTYSNFLFPTKSWKSVTKSYDVSMSHCLSLNLKASNKGKEIHIHEIQFVKLKW